MILTFDRYTITGTPQEIDEFITIHNTTTVMSNGANYETGTIRICCPKCYSTKVKALYGTSRDGGENYTHYICNDCHEEFDV